MTILCHGDCHVWLGASSLCTCEALRQALRQAQDGTQDATHRVAMYGFNPFGPHAPQPTPTAPDVPLAQFHAAQQSGASHLSADGLTAYDERGSVVWRCFWDEETKAFGGWWRTDAGLPADAVKIE